MKRYLFLLLALCVGLLARPVSAQTDPDPPPAQNIPKVHVVVEGDSLSSIAAQYGTTVDALLQVNEIDDAAFLYIGQEIIIPGLGGAAIPIVYTVEFGDTLAGISARYNTTPTLLAENNNLLNPYYLVAGRDLDVVSRTGSFSEQAITGQIHVVEAGDTWLTIANQYNLSPLALAGHNHLPYPSYLYNGQRLLIPSDTPYQDLVGEWRRVVLQGMPALQGQTLSLYVENFLDGTPTGFFDDRPLQFAPQGEGYITMIGLDAFTPAGIHTMTLTGEGTSHPWTPFTQSIYVGRVFYGQQELTLTGETADLLDPVLVNGERELFETLYNSFTPEQLWTGSFQMPVSPTLPTTAGYGIARSYNGGPYDSFHSGTDFAGYAGTPVYAPANGRVRFAQPVEVRGNIIILDHGLGVMTGYYHLSAFHVQEGDIVTRGQLIGELGTTGLSTGPHLHWDVRILNVAVSPLQWTEVAFP